MAYKYPNLAAEISRDSLDYKDIYSTVAESFGKSTDTVSNWFTGRAGAMPTSVAFFVRDEYFPSLTVDYLFSETPMQPTS